MSGRSQHDYDAEMTNRCERVLLTVLGDIGPWSERIYLVGGLAPRYLVGRLPDGVPAHVGTADIDLVIGIAIDQGADEAYRTLQTNLRGSGFEPGEHSFQWNRSVDGVTVSIEFLCETEEVDFGRIFRPKDGAGSKLSAFNVKGAGLVADDYITVDIEGERLDDGGMSSVQLRVAGLLSYVVLKILAFQDRHHNKDAYDLVFTLLNYPGGVGGAAAAASESAILHHPTVRYGLTLLGERFAQLETDGPSAYSAFLGDLSDPEMIARLRREAHRTVATFLQGVEYSG